MQVEIDLALTLLRASAALDVDDIRAVEHGHVDGMARVVAQLLQMWRGDRPQLHRVDRGEAKVEHARAESVFLGRCVLL